MCFSIEHCICQSLVLLCYIYFKSYENQPNTFRTGRALPSGHPRLRSMVTFMYLYVFMAARRQSLGLYVTQWLKRLLELGCNAEF